MSKPTKTKPEKEPAKMGRPRKEVRVHIHTTVLPETKAVLDQRAAAESKPVGEIIDALINQ